MIDKTVEIIHTNIKYAQLIYHAVAKRWLVGKIIRCRYA